jgi:MFS family permease
MLAIPFGAWADRSARWKVFVTGHVFLLGGYTALLLSGLGWIVVPFVLVTLGAYYAATDGVLSAMASAVLPRAERGSGLGLLATATSLGRRGASLVFGWVWSRWDDTTALVIFLGALPAGILVGSVMLARAEREIIAP